jgi:glycosyltransferase involved in cell wall biosynthesis
LARRTKNFAVQIVGRRFYDRELVDDYGLELARLGSALEKEGVPCRFPGWMDRSSLPDVLGAAHIGVIPSRWDEPSALTIYEAMASGLATIGSRTGGTPEIIGDAGFLFDRDDDAGLADLLEPLIKDPTLRAEYGRRARARAEQFSWTSRWRQVRELVTETVSRKANISRSV